MPGAKYELRGHHVTDGMPLSGSFSAETLERIKTFSLVDQDVVITAYAKTGSLWVQEIVWGILKHDQPPSDPDESGSMMKFMMKVPFMEFYNPKLPMHPLDKLAEMSSPRIMKTHLPARYFEKHLTGDSVKFVVPVRNPRDALVSFYHFHRDNMDLGSYAGTWDEFFEVYRSRELMYGDFFDWYRGYLPYRDRPNVCLVKYESLKADPAGEVRRLAAFFGRTLTDEVVADIVERTSFDSMKKTISGGEAKESPFVRKGRVGGWKDYFSPEQSSTVDGHYQAWLAAGGYQLDFQ